MYSRVVHLWNCRWLLHTPGLTSFCPKIQIVWFCSTLQPYSIIMNTFMLFDITWLYLTFPEHHNQPPLSCSRSTWLVSHSNPCQEQSDLRKKQFHHVCLKMLREATALIMMFVLICIHQCYPASAVMPGAVFRAYSWVLLKTIAKCCLLLLSGAAFWIESKPVG